MTRARDMANLGSQAGSGLDASDITTGTLGNTVQDNVTRLGTVTVGNIDAVSDIVKVASDAFSAENTFDIQGCFSSAYKFYKLFIGGYASDDVAFLKIQYLDSSHAAIAGTYSMKGNENYTYQSAGGDARWNNSSTTATRDQHDSTTGFKIMNTWTLENSSNDFEGQTVEMFFYDPIVAEKQIVHWVTTISQEDYVASGNYFGLHHSTTPAYGLKMHLSTGNFIAKGHWAVYGYKI